MECDERTKIVNSVIRSIISVGKCNTQTSLNGKRLTYKNIVITDDQFNLIQQKLSTLNCEVRKYQSIYKKLILTIRVKEYTANNA
jgi:hypothetical protein